MRPNLSYFDSASVREFLKKNPYVTYRGKNIEFETPIPLSQVFWGSCNDKAIPPTQNKFIHAVLAKNQKHFPEGLRKNQILRRCSLAWGSFIMELDFYCQIRDSKLPFNIIKDVELDLKFGYDFIITYKGKGFYLHVFIDTPRSWYYIDKKDWRKKHIEIKPIHFPLKRFQADIVGGLCLYRFSHVVKLYRTILNEYPLNTGKEHY